MSSGRLVVVGTGLITPQHITQEAKQHIQAADVVFHVIPDLLGIDYLKSLNENLIDLGTCYQETDNRRETYKLMTQRIMDGVKSYQNVVVVFYGHPGVFVTSTHKAMEQAKEMGVFTYMLPGISAADCLYADLNLDPGKYGIQSYEATYFLRHKITLNTFAPSLFWQIGVVADMSANTECQPHPDGLEIMKNKLIRFYPSDHIVGLYEGSVLPVIESVIHWFPLSELNEQTVNPHTTLVVPELNQPEIDESFIHQWPQLNSQKKEANHV